MHKDNHYLPNVKKKWMKVFSEALKQSLFRNY